MDSPTAEEIDIVQCILGNVTADYEISAVGRFLAAYERQREALEHIKFGHCEHIGANCSCVWCIARAALGGDDD